LVPWILPALLDSRCVSLIATRVTTKYKNIIKIFFEIFLLSCGFSYFSLSFSQRNKYYPLRRSYDEVKKIKKAATLKEKIQSAMQSIETLYIFSTLVFVAVMIYLGNGSKDGVTTQGFYIYGTLYPFWVYGLASALFGVIFFCYICTLRI